MSRNGSDDSDRNRNANPGGDANRAGDSANRAHAHNDQSSGGGPDPAHRDAALQDAARPRASDQLLTPGERARGDRTLAPGDHIPAPGDRTLDPGAPVPAPGDRVLAELIRRCDAGESVALCTVVAARGSTPQAAGARMLLVGDGRTIGTLGGGCVEAEVRQQAITLLHAGLSKLLTFKLDHDYGWDDGLICGGSMDIYVQTHAHAVGVEPYRVALDALQQGRPAALSIAYEVDGAPKVYSETIDPPGKLLIVGAGHVGQALAALAASLQFEVSVLDDRADCASAERFPSAAARHVADIESSLRDWPIDAQTYVVIVTRGHRHDGKALAAVIDSPAKYLGLIGSKRKVKTIFQDLLEQGAPVEKLLRVHAPIGLEIGAVTVPEIAVSIAAELVAVRRGRGGAAALPLKFDPAKLRELLEMPR